MNPKTDEIVTRFNNRNIRVLLTCDDVDAICDWEGTKKQIVDWIENPGDKPEGLILSVTGIKVEIIGLQTGPFAFERTVNGNQERWEFPTYQAMLDFLPRVTYLTKEDCAPPPLMRLDFPDVTIDRESIAKEIAEFNPSLHKYTPLPPINSEPITGTDSEGYALNAKGLRFDPPFKLDPSNTTTILEHIPTIDPDEATS